MHRPILDRRWLGRSARILGFAFLASVLLVTGRFLARADSSEIPDLAVLTPQVRQARPALVAERAAVAGAIRTFNGRVRQFNGACGSVDSRDAGAVRSCSDRQTQLAAQKRDIVSRIIAYNAEARGAYRPSGNGLVGGGTWATGFNVQAGADRALVKRARALMKRQMELAGVWYPGIDFDRYNFVIGIAASTDLLTIEGLPEWLRLLHDDRTNGQFSAQNQAAYDSLRGRQFNDLSCHSNGAMICLAALANGDVIADRVTLFGPQITENSLKMWNALLQTGRVKSVQLVLNESDPIPAMSLLFGQGGARTTALAGVAFFKPNVLSRFIHETSPRIAVRTFACGTGTPALACHELTVYRRDLGCKPTSRAVVPGTTIRGKGTLEPPPPC